MHPGELVVNYARLPSKPPYKSKIPKGGFGALWRVFLPYLSSRKERYGPRRAYRKENAGKYEKQKDYAPKVAGKVERQVKTQNKTIAPPEVVGLVERLVKNVQRKMVPPEVVPKRECP